MVGYVADTVGAYATRKSTFRDNIKVSSIEETSLISLTLVASASLFVYSLRSPTFSMALILV